jgi:hypothetical protein
MGAGELNMADADEASKMLKWLIPVMAILLLIVLALSLGAYTHPMPEQDCSKPYDYPICWRAGMPELYTPPSTPMVFLSMVIVAIVAIILGYVGYHATVIEQATIITPTATIGKPTGMTAASSAPAPTPLASPSGITPTSPSPTPTPQTSASAPTNVPSKSTPTSQNPVATPAKHLELPILPPTAKPMQGVDPAKVK